MSHRDDGDPDSVRPPLPPMQAIGEALVRTYQWVAEEKVPDRLLELLERLGASTPEPAAAAQAADKARSDGAADTDNSPSIRGA